MAKAYEGFFDESKEEWIIWVEKYQKSLRQIMQTEADEASQTSFIQTNIFSIIEDILSGSFFFGVLFFLGIFII